jgi:hypothetical protein
MTFLHSVSPFRRVTADAAGHASLSVHGLVTSTENCGVANLQPAADQMLFAPYQPLHRPPYDLRNIFDRTNLAIVIRGHIDRCESYVALARQMHGDGRMSDTDFAERAGQRMADLREHRNALFRLNELGRN